ncbi:efflux RND transporter periplasmic adaptor subunit [Aeromonas rivipollensis]|uniref:efflux RND transporter periplasmic adaptor subunit n=1 Tax=Aeromonas rivipollensis TaxID=948519 RepID=UPI0013D5ACDD|nr:efflux RND transporter periplasmic adaptor subunit [Aeromonas rivipollensis]NEX80969.1 efflux RND transporter periplasmic adaptor subunit [Aeromonas rivipollensis]
MNKRVLMSALLLALGAGGGYWAAKQSTDGATVKEKTPLYWVNPMDPRDKRDGPAKDNMGMDFIPVYEEQKNGSPGTVTISPEIQQNLGVRLAKVEKLPIHQQIETVGYVGYDEDKLTAINARMAGWIRTLAIKSEGQKVAKGTLLYEIYAPDLVNAQHEYLLALNTSNPLLLRAAEGKLKSLQVPADQIAALKGSRRVRETIGIYAPSSGYVSELKVREGQYVEPAAALFNISTLKQVWVSAEVFERQAAQLKVGDPVTMTLDYAPGRSWQGRVDYLYPTLDAATRTLKVRLRFDNPDEFLKPNMFAKVTIQAGKGEPQMVVPSEAVIRTGSQDRLVLALGDGNFKSVAVTLGPQFGDKVAIKAGVEAGDSIVSSAQFLLDSESAIDSDFQRMTAVRPAQVWTQGTVQSMDLASRTLMVAHQPIPEWQWPAMEMEFIVADGVDISRLAQGQSLHLQVMQEGDEYRITSIHQEKAPATDGAAKPVTDEMDKMEGMDHSQHQMGDKP